MLARRPRSNPSWASYLCPIVTLLLLTLINVVLAAIPLIVPGALVTITINPGTEADPVELSPTRYQYAPSLLLLTYGVALSLVTLSILAGSVLLWWGYEARTSLNDEEETMSQDSALDDYQIMDLRK